MTKRQGSAPKKSTSLKKGYYKNIFHIKNKVGTLLETMAIFYTYRVFLFTPSVRIKENEEP